MYFLSKSKLLVIWFTYIGTSYVLDGVQSQCIGGTVKTTNTSKGKPEVELQLSKKDIFVDETAFFNCNVRSNPGAEVFWLYEGKFITNELQRAAYVYKDCNTSLTIRYAEPRDTGRYSCMAKNSHGETTSERISLLVQQKAKFEKLYKKASIEIVPPRLCDQTHENVKTLKCACNESQGICTWKRSNRSMSTEKISYCDDRMCCLSIRDFAKEDAGLYTCFMYFDVCKAQIKIPEPIKYNTEDDMQQNKTKNDRGENTGKASKIHNHLGVWLSAVVAVIAVITYF